MRIDVRSGVALISRSYTSNPTTHEPDPRLADRCLCRKAHFPPPSACGNRFATAIWPTTRPWMIRSTDSVSPRIVGTGYAARSGWHKPRSRGRRRSRSSIPGFRRRHKSRFPQDAANPAPKMKRPWGRVSSDAGEVESAPPSPTSDLSPGARSIYIMPPGTPIEPNHEPAIPPPIIRPPSPFRPPCHRTLDTRPGRPRGVPAACRPGCQLRFEFPRPPREAAQSSASGPLGAQAGEVAPVAEEWVLSVGHCRGRRRGQDETPSLALGLAGAVFLSWFAGCP